MDMKGVISKKAGDFLISWVNIASPKESLPWSEKEKRFT